MPRNSSAVHLRGDGGAVALLLIALYATLSYVLTDPASGAAKASAAENPRTTVRRRRAVRRGSTPVFTG